MNATDDILHEIFWVESRFNQVDAANKPFFCIFALLQANVSSSFKLSEQLSNRDLINVS